jgi:hypothetical protein
MLTVYLSKCGGLTYRSLVSHRSSVRGVGAGDANV